MIVWICTDMEGLAGVDKHQQCLPDHPQMYRYGLEQLTEETNAAVAGCFDAGASEVRILDGHGWNKNKGFIRDRIDSRAQIVWRSSTKPLRFEGLDESVSALAVIGQHAMAGTIGGFYDHTGSSKTVCSLKINGQEHGELSQITLYAGYYDIPLVYASGDEALCEEARRLFPHVRTTPTKRGIDWNTCELYPVEEVRRNIRRDIAEAVSQPNPKNAWKPSRPIEIEYEYAWTGLADALANVDGVDRPHPRRVRWRIDDPRDFYTHPSHVALT